MVHWKPWKQPMAEKQTMTPNVPEPVIPSRAAARRADLLRECIATGMFTRGTVVSDLERRILQELERGDE